MVISVPCPVKLIIDIIVGVAKVMLAMRITSATLGACLSREHKGASHSLDDLVLVGFSIGS
jgi:hypothetical protein